MFVTDVEKMYRQIRVHQDDWRLQRILWREDGREEAREFALTTVTYGLSCAPYLAMRTLKQLAEDEEARFPKGADALRQDAYVDDVLSGADQIREALELRDQLSQLSAAGGFPLRKWAANDDALLEGVPAEHRADRAPITWDKLESHTALGLQWQAPLDSFSFRISPGPEGPISRRVVLSRTAGLFDPLGWLAPVVVRAKIFVQQTWLLQLDWDDPLTGRLAKEWREFERALPTLREVRVPRWLGVTTSLEDAELHGFADASERAYAAVVYLRTGHGGRDVGVSLVMSKTRVAPLKPVSLLRLELCAALMLVRLVEHVQ